MLITDIDSNYAAMRTWYYVSEHTSSQRGDWALKLLLEYTEKQIAIQFTYSRFHSVDNYVLIPLSQDHGSAEWLFRWIKDEV